MSNFLINEQPIYLLPSLANKLGINGAIILQQLHFWLRNKSLGKTIDGVKWYRNTIENWHENDFNFLSESTIYRTFNKLEELEIVLSRSDLNSIGYDRTKWYAINYEKLDEILNGISQFDEMDLVKVKNGFSQSETTIPNIPSNIPSNIGSDSLESETAILFQQSEVIAESENEQQIMNEIENRSSINLFDLLNDSPQIESSYENLIANKNHPAIIMWRSITKRFPKKELWEMICNSLGSNPNRDVLSYVIQKWIARGYNKMNIDGQLSWYNQALEWHNQGYELELFEPKFNKPYYQKNQTELSGTLRGLTFE